MKKILFIINNLRRTGPVNLIYDSVSHLDRDNYLIEILTLSKESQFDNSRYQDFVELGIKIYTIECHLMDFLGRSSLISKQLSNINPDIIHSHGIKADYINVLFNKAGNSISTSHNVPILDYTMTYGKILGFLMSCVQIFLFRYMSAVVCCSNSVFKFIDKFCKGNNIFSINNGINVESFNLIGKHGKEYFRTKLGLPLNAIIFITSGNLSKRKDPEFLANFWKKHLSNSNYHMVFIGDGELRDRCNRLFSDMKNVHFLGKVNNVAEYLSACDFYISASKAEGLPLAVIEAMAAGLPVVLSDINPHCEILNLGDNIGCTYEINSEESLLRSFDLLNSQDYDILSSNVLSLAMTHLSAKEMALKYESVYSFILNEVSRCEK